MRTSPDASERIEILSISDYDLFKKLDHRREMLYPPGSGGRPRLGGPKKLTQPSMEKPGAPAGDTISRTVLRDDLVRETNKQKKAVEPSPENKKRNRTRQMT